MIESINLHTTELIGVGEGDPGYDRAMTLVKNHLKKIEQTIQNSSIYIRPVDEQFRTYIHQFFGVWSFYTSAEMDTKWYRAVSMHEAYLVGRLKSTQGQTQR
jgi:hypothetical protein